MNAYFNFLSSHWFIRAFIAIFILIDLICIYAGLFDRDLLRRLALRFFGALSGKEARIPRPIKEPPIPWYSWVGFWFICAIPPAGWIALETLWRLNASNRLR